MVCMRWLLHITANNTHRHSDDIARRPTTNHRAPSADLMMYASGGRGVLVA